MIDERESFDAVIRDEVAAMAAEAPPLGPTPDLGSGMARQPWQRAPRVVTVAASVLVIAGVAAAMIVVARGDRDLAEQSATGPAAAPTTITDLRSDPAAQGESSALRPAGFPRLSLGPQTIADVGAVLVGVQDYSVVDGWFSFLNYERTRGDNTSAVASVTVFSGDADDLNYVTCDVSEPVSHAGRSVSLIALDRSEQVLRLGWIEGPSTVVVLETTGVAVAQALDAVDDLVSPSASDWDVMVDQLPPSEVVTSANAEDAIWATYTRDTAAAAARDAPPGIPAMTDGPTTFCSEAHPVTG